MNYVYALKSLNKNYIYVGITKNIDERLKRHNQGYEKTTKPYRPFILIYQETFASRVEARKKEIYLKSGIGKEFLKNLSV
jgi:putative endonuclease